MKNTEAKPVLVPNCMIPYKYGIIQFGTQTGLAPVMKNNEYK